MENLRKVTWDDIILESNCFVDQGSFAMIIKGKWRKFAHFDESNSPVIAIKLITETLSFAQRKVYQNEREILVKEAILLSLCKDYSARNTIEIYGIVEGKLSEKLSKCIPSSREGDQAFGIMLEYFDAKSLFRLLPASSASSVSPAVTPGVFFKTGEKIKILLDIMIGLHDLHASGIIHGDIKPQNILLSKHIPPMVKIVDFGLSKAHEHLIARSFAESSLISTDVFGGTLVYCAPEINPYVTGNFHEPTRSSDIYSFALVAWEILSFSRLPPFLGINSTTADNHHDKRPPMTSLPLDIPPSIMQMIENCWNAERSKRLPASRCLSILQSAHHQFEGGNFDLFFSHAWLNKDILSHLHNLLVRSGYRVWYDEVDMGYDMKDSMRRGIASSKIILVCLNRHYQSRENCLFELREAVASQKPIVVFLLEEKPEDWASEEVKKACQFRDNMYVDASALPDRFQWADVQAGDFTAPAFLALNEHAMALKRLFTELQCFPAFDQPLSPPPPEAVPPVIPPNPSLIVPSFSNKQFILCDIGSDTIKFVLGVNIFKVYTYRNVLGRLQSGSSERLLFGEEVWDFQRNTQFGGEVPSSLEILFPIEVISSSSLGSFLTIKWQEMLELLRHVIVEKFLVDAAVEAPTVSLEWPVMININGISILDFQLAQKKLQDVFRERLLFKQAFVAHPGFFAELWRGLNDVVLFNIGELATQVIFVQEGACILDRSLNVGGYHVTQTLADLLAYQGLGLDFEQVRELKERYCYCAVDVEEELQLMRETVVMDSEPILLPNGRSFSLQSERFLALEVLFHPSNVLSVLPKGSAFSPNVYYSTDPRFAGLKIPGPRKLEQAEQGIHLFLCNAIAEFYKITAAQELPYILVFGGTADAPGLRQRLETEVKKLYRQRFPKLTQSKIDRKIKFEKDVIRSTDFLTAVASEPDFLERYCSRLK